MKSLVFWVILSATVIAFAGNAPDTTTVDALISNTSKKLNSINHVSYTYYIEANYLSENYHRDVSKKVYLEFNEKEPLLGLLFTDMEKDYASVFNGEQYFYINKKANTIERTEKPISSTFRSQTSFVNSYYTLRRFLPTILASDSIQRVVADTTINGKKFNAFRFMLTNAMMGRFGRIEKLSIEKNITYTVIVNEENWPIQVVQRDNVNPADYTLVTFTDVQINRDRPTPDTWQYETYAKLYKPVTK